MVFNPDITKQAVEVIFSVKNKNPSHPELIFNGVPVARENCTKHLGVHLDSHLNFSKHIREAILKASKGINLLKYLSKFVDRKVLDMCYKLYVRPHLVYGDVIYHNQRIDLMNLIEQVQYKAGLIVSVCWQGTNRERLYDELGWESMSNRRWFRRLTLFYKISNGHTPSYLADQITERSEMNINLRRRHSTIAPPSRTERYTNSIFPYCISHWNELDDSVKNLPSISSFKEHLIKFNRPPRRTFYGICDRFGIRLLTKIRVGFSDLRDHRFNHNFKCESPTCTCEIDDETPVHLFLCYPRYNIHRLTLLSKISDIIGSDISVLLSDHLCNILVYGSNVYNSISNELIITETIHYIRTTGRFTNPEASS